LTTHRGFGPFAVDPEGRGRPPGLGLARGRGRVEGCRSALSTSEPASRPDYLQSPPRGGRGVERWLGFSLHVGDPVPCRRASGRPRVGRRGGASHAPRPKRSQPLRGRGRHPPPHAAAPGRAGGGAAPGRRKPPCGPAACFPHAPASSLLPGVRACADTAVQPLVDEWFPTGALVAPQCSAVANKWAASLHDLKVLLLAPGTWRSYTPTWRRM